MEFESSFYLTFSLLNDVFLHKAPWRFHFLVSQAKFIVIQ